MEELEAVLRSSVNASASIHDVFTVDATMHLEDRHIDSFVWADLRRAVNKAIAGTYWKADIIPAHVKGGTRVFITLYRASGT